jgi:hypothetical protein
MLRQLDEVRGMSPLRLGELRCSDAQRGLNALAAILRAEGDLAGARTLLERALAIRENVLGIDHPNTLTIREHLQSIGE